MSILKKLGLFKSEKPDDEKENAGEAPARDDAEKPDSTNPHETGGCCGGCGGTQEKPS